MIKKSLESTIVLVLLFSQSLVEAQSACDKEYGFENLVNCFKEKLCKDCPPFSRSEYFIRDGSPAEPTLVCHVPKKEVTIDRLVTSSEFCFMADKSVLAKFTGLLASDLFNKKSKPALDGYKIENGDLYFDKDLKFYPLRLSETYHKLIGETPIDYVETGSVYPPGNENRITKVALLKDLKACEITIPRGSKLNSTMDERVITIDSGPAIKFKGKILKYPIRVMIGKKCHVEELDPNLD